MDEGQRSMAANNGITAEMERKDERYLEER